MALATVSSKAVVLLLLNHWFLKLFLCGVFCNRSLFFYVVLSLLFSVTIISLREGKLVALLKFSFSLLCGGWCSVSPLTVL